MGGRRGKLPGVGASIWPGVWSAGAGAGVPGGLRPDGRPGEGGGGGAVLLAPPAVRSAGRRALCRSHGGRTVTARAGPHFTAARGEPGLPAGLPV